MCARYVFTSGRSFGDEFGVAAVPDLTPRYNIAPTQTVPAVRQGPGGREAVVLRWGLVPSWAKDPAIGARLINARAETVEEKPSFRTALRKRRCLIPADGFFEWKHAGGVKQPYFLTCRRTPFAFAGLYEHWDGPDGPLDTCTIVTTTANQLVGQVHDRMPVILAPDEYEVWLDPDAPTGLAVSLLDSFPADEMRMYPVGRAVGNPRVDDPSLIEPVGPTTLF